MDGKHQAQNGNSTDVTLITGLAAGNTTFTSSVTPNGGKTPMVVTVFAPTASGPSTYTWTGALNSVWSLASSDTNWSLAGTSGNTSYSEAGSPNVYFSDGPANTHVMIAAGGVQPASVTFTNNNPYTLSGGPLNGGGTVTMNGYGNVTLSNANGYSGGTLINNGTLTAAADTSLGSGTVSVGGTLNFTSGNPTIGDLYGGGSVVLGNGGTGGSTTLTVNAGGVNIFSGVIQQAAGATGSLVKAGNGTLTLSNANQYSGSTTLLAGRLVASNMGAFGSSSLQGLGRHPGGTSASPIR